MDDPIEKDFASFHEKLKTSSLQERPSLYTQEIERLAFKLREETLGYEHAKVDGEFLDEAEIENHLDRLALMIDKLRHEQRSLDVRTPVKPFPSPAAASPKLEPTPAKLLFSLGKPLNRKRLNMPQAAEYLGIAKQTLYQWCSEKKIPHKKVGSRTFLDADELDAWIAKRHVKPIGDLVKARLARVTRKEAGAAKKPL